MSVLEAILLGIVQGITEFLPVSSSGHLAIFQNLLGIETEGGVFFDVLLHIGTLVALFMAFRKDVSRLLLEACRIAYDLYRNARIYIDNHKNNKNGEYIRVIGNNYRKFVVLILVSAIPTGLLGFFSRHLVEAASGNLLAPGIGLLITAVLLLVVGSRKSGTKIPKDASYADAMWIGICQGIAVFPGISRSGMTIAASLLCGFNRNFAVKYSFLMSIPAIIGAALLELTQLGKANLTLGLAGTYLLGAVAAGIVGYFAIKFMIVIVQRKKFTYFAYYCFLIGLIAIISNFVRA